MISSCFDKATKDELKKIAMDLIILLILNFLIITTYYFIPPFKRGFFCDDESLMHPYSESTVGSSLGYVGFGAPIFVIVITEIARWKLNVNEESVKLFNRDLPVWVPDIYQNVVAFLFGAFVTISTTDIGKHVVGRLRPHFMSVCQPVMLDGTNCSDSINFRRYIVDYECTNSNSTEEMLNDMKLSFPSGHSSLSMFAMAFTTLYVQHSMNWKGSTLLKHLLQFIFFNAAWFTALSRISDYKHHWSDVLFGSLMGVTFAWITFYAVANVKRERKLKIQPATPINAHTNPAFDSS